MPTATTEFLLASTGSAVSMRDLMLNMPPVQEKTFKQVGGLDLKFYYCTPPDVMPGERHPGVVWIHGGGWEGGTCDGFIPHMRYMAVRGAVGFNISYRLLYQDALSIGECLADCKTALRYIRAHADEFGVDPERIVVAGDSAGGHLAACLGTVKGFDDPADDLSVSAKPNAMILYNPIVDMTEGQWVRYIMGRAAQEISVRELAPSAEQLELARKLSPLFNVRPGQPPTLLMHGLADIVVTPEQARRFAEAMQRSGNQCELILSEGFGHAFVVPVWKASESVVVEAVRSADAFLCSLGYLQGAPTLVVSHEPAWTGYGPTAQPFNADTQYQ